MRGEGCSGWRCPAEWYVDRGDDLSIVVGFEERHGAFGEVAAITWLPFVVHVGQNDADQKERLSAATRPACWSEMTNRSPPSPRFFFRSVRNARQKTSSSESPTSRPRDDRDLAAAVSGDPGGDDHGHRDDLGGGVADVQVGRVEIDVGDSVWSSRRVRNSVTTSSSPAQIRDTSDLQMPESMPRAATRSSTDRVETPRM
jgi:hypothetical protein